MLLQNVTTVTEYFKQIHIFKITKQMQIAELALYHVALQYGSSNVITLKKHSKSEQVL